MKAVKRAYLDLDRLRITVSGMRKGSALAKHWGISRNTVQRRLSGEFRMTLEMINEICEFIGVDIDEFLEIKQAA